MKFLNIPSWVWTVVRIIISSGLIAWLAFRFDWRQVWETIRDIPFAIILVSLAFFFASQLFTARRLQRLLTDQGILIKYRQVLGLNFTGLFASNYLPSTIGGDGLKLILLITRGARKTTAAASLAADRLINLVSMFFFLPCAFTLAGSMSLQVDQTSLPVLAYVLITLTIISIVLAIFIIRIRSHPREKMPAWLKRVIQIAGNIFEIMKIWFSKPGTGMVSFFLSIMGILCSFFASWFLLHQGFSIHIDPFEWIAISMMVYFISTLPISVNGLGLQETGFVYLLAQFGAASEISLSFALLIRFLTLVVSLPGLYGIITKPEKQPGMESV